MPFQSNFCVHIFSVTFLVFFCTNNAISQLRRCSDYDYTLYFPKLNSWRYVKTVIRQDIGEYTICTWFRLTSFTTSDQTFASYATSDQPADLDRVYVSYRSSTKVFRYLWKSVPHAYFRSIDSSSVDVTLNIWHHFCIERRLNNERVAFYVNGSLLSSHDNLGNNIVHPRGGVFTLGEEQDELEWGFDSKQTYHGEFAQYNMWTYPLGAAVIARLHSGVGSTETGDLIAWPDVKSFEFNGDVRVLRPSPVFNLNAFDCSFSDWLCNSDICAGADFNCQSNPSELRIQSCHHYYVCQSPKCPRNCRELLELGKNEDFLYFIDPMKSGRIRTFCDQSTNGGGWSVIQRRFNGEETFDRDWKAYKGGFGPLNREMWLGNDLIHNMTAAKPFQLLLELNEHQTNYEMDPLYQNFSVSDEDGKYSLTVSGNPSEIDKLSDHNGMAFTTKDEDNDLDGSNCAGTLHGGWWFKDCGLCNLNGFYTDGTVSTMFWNTGNFLTFSEMKVRPFTVDLPRPRHFIFRFANHNTNPGYIRIKRLSSLEEFTISWWIRAERARNAWTTVFSLRLLSQSLNYLEFSFKNDEDFKIVILSEIATGSLPKFSFTDSHWHSFVLTWSKGSKTASLYFDGVLRFTEVLNTNNNIARGGQLTIGVKQQANGDLEQGTQFLGDMTRFNIWNRILSSSELVDIMRCTYDGHGELLAWPDVRYWKHGKIIIQNDGNQFCDAQSSGKFHWPFHNESSPGQFLDQSGQLQIKTSGSNVTNQDKSLVVYGKGNAIIEELAGHCINDPDRCQGRGITISLWMHHGGLISDILKDNNFYHQTLMSWLAPVVLGAAQWFRCFKASEDGWRISSFHTNCDYKGPTVTLVKVRDYIFGGFLDQNWGGYNRYLGSHQAFVFSLHGPNHQSSPLKIAIMASQTAKAAKTGSNIFQFGKGPDFSLSEDLKNGHSNLGGSYAPPPGFQASTSKARNLLAGMEHFVVDEIETFYAFVPSEAVGVSDASIIPDSALTSSSEATYSEATWMAVQHARFNSSSSSGAWCRAPEDRQPWYQVDLIVSTEIQSIVLQTRHWNNNRVTTFSLSYSNDGIAWSYFLNLNSSTKVFESGLSSSVPMNTVDIVPSITTRFFRINILTWHGECCLRFELYGTNGALGMKNSNIANDQLSASSWRDMRSTYKSRLNMLSLTGNAWCPSNNDPDKWLQIDCGKVETISHVATQGRVGTWDMVKTFSLGYSTNEIDWFDHEESGAKKVFVGNSERHITAHNLLLKPMIGRYVRFYPVSSGGSLMCMRVELYRYVANYSNSILSSGATSFLGTGISLHRQWNITKNHAPYVVIVKSTHRFWKLDLDELPGGWNHVAFTWNLKDGLKLYLNGLIFKHIREGQPIEISENVLPKPDSSFTIGDPFWPQSMKVMNFKLEDAITLPALLFHDHFTGLFEVDNIESSQDDNSWRVGNSNTPSDGTGPNKGYNDNFSDHALYRLTGGANWDHTLLGVDGSISMAASGDNCAVVTGIGASWWLDFGESKNISKVYISSSSQCCNLASPTVTITVQESSGISPSAEMECVNAYDLSSSDEHFIDCLRPLTGRYLVVQPAPGQTLSFCEVATFSGEFLYLYLESSYPRKKGDKAVTESGFFNAAYNCLSLKYHMLGDNVGRLDVYTEDIEGNSQHVWRLAGNQSSSWSVGKANLVNNRPFKVVLSSMVGDGFQGDIAVGSVTVTVDPDCGVIPVQATPKGQLTGVRSGILGDFSDLAEPLLSRLSSFSNQSYWTTCYRHNNHTQTNQTFQQHCTNRGPTLILARTGNIVVGAFADQSWTGSNTSIWSLHSFLFLLSHTENFRSFELDESKRDSAMFDFESCPSFGSNGVELKFNMSNNGIELRAGTTFDNFHDLYEAVRSENGGNFTASDMEVLLLSDSVCYPPCPLNKRCDEITAKCICDHNHRSRSWCERGTAAETIFNHSANYWSMDEYDNLKDNRKISWGKAHGKVTFDVGVNKEAVYFADALTTIDLGNRHPCQPNFPTSCTNGFSISFWLKYSLEQTGSSGSLNTLISIGSLREDCEGLKIFLVNNALEHLAVSFLANNNKCVYTFLVPEAVWSHVVITWHPITDLMIYVNGKRIADFMESQCFAINLAVSSEPLVLRSGHGVKMWYDEVVFWDHIVTSEQVNSVYRYYYKDLPTIHVKLVLKMPAVTWTEEILDKESLSYRSLAEQMNTNIQNLYSELKVLKVEVYSCWNNQGVVCQVLVDLSASFYNEVVPLKNAITVLGTLGSMSVETEKMEILNVPSFDFNFNVSSESAKYLTVSWEIPDEVSHYFQGFHVFYRSNITGITENVTSYGINTETKLPLSRWALYDVYMVPFSLTGWGKQSAVKTVVSLEAAPTIRPHNATACNSSSTSIMIQWDAVETELFYRRLRGYVCTVREEENTSVVVVNQIVDTSFTSLSVGNLKKFTWYFIEVAALSDKPGPFINITVRTAEDVPSRAPLNLATVDRNSRSAYITWSEVPEEFLHGILRGYKIRYFQSNLGSSTASTVNVTASAPHSGRKKRAVSTPVIAQAIEIDGLIPYTNYSIQLAAFTIGDGVWTEWLSYTTDEEVPKSPPLNVTVQNTSSTSLLVSWSPVPVHLRRGIIRGYWLIYKRGDLSNGNITRLVVEPWLTSFEIRSLRKYTLYNVKMTAFTVKGESNETEPVSCWTDEDVPGLPPSYLSFRATGLRSLTISWSPVPADFQHGIILGYQLKYNKPEGQQFAFNFTVNETKKDIADLKPYTRYPTFVSAFTKKGLGPWAYVLTLTETPDPYYPPLTLGAASREYLSALNVTWLAVNLTEMFGVFEIKAIRIFYQELSTGFVRPAVERTEKTQDCYNVEDGHCLVTGLKAFTLYRLRASWKNDFGLGPFTKVIEAGKTTIRAAQLPKQGAIPFRYSKMTKHIFIHSMPRTKGVDYKAKNFALFALLKEKLLQAIILDDFSLFTVTKGLSIIIEGSTDINDEDFVIIFNNDSWAKTCRCNERFTTNYYSLPPYVNLKYEDSRVNMSGILATVLQDAITNCCLDCGEHGLSAVDFGYNGLDQPAEMLTEKEMKNRIGPETDISFPVYGHKHQTLYGGRFAFSPLIESPGVAMIVRSALDVNLSMQLVHSILNCWPLGVLMIVLASLAGVVIWMMETVENPEQFPSSTIPGIANGFWWAYITMTTVGYGDRYPISIQGRIVGLIWTLIGLVITSFTVGAITSALSLVVEISDPSSMRIYGLKVGAVANTSEYRLAFRLNANMNKDVQYLTLEELKKDLLDGQIDAIMLDVYRIGHFKDSLGNKDLQLARIIDYNMVYGVVWNGQSEALTTCLSQYTKHKRAQIFERIEAIISVAELKTDNDRLEIVLNVFDPKSKIFLDVLKYSLICLGVLVLVGSFWVCIRRRIMKSKVGVVGKSNLIERRDVAVFQSLLENFDVQTKRETRQLIRRHINEVKAFRELEKEKTHP